MTSQSRFPQEALVIAQTHAQAAVAVELYTLPFYLSALASLQAGSKSLAYAPLVSVCTEEMLHLELAANICVALGVPPNFTAPEYGPTITPKFPDGTPILDPKVDPATGQSGAIYAVIGNLVDALPTMLNIEVPTEFEPPDFELMPPYASIGQFYAALKSAATAAEIVTPSYPAANQVSGVFAKQAFPEIIRNLTELLRVIDVICDQGEGKEQSPPPTPPFQESDFMVANPADILMGANSDQAGQKEYNHFGRFIYLQSLNLSTDDVYTGTPNPTSTENGILQKGFGALIKNMTDLWSGDQNVYIMDGMKDLLTDATNVWKAGSIPQWTPVS